MKPAAQRKLTLQAHTVKVLSTGELLRVVGGESNGCDPLDTNRPSWCCKPP